MSTPGKFGVSESRLETKNCMDCRRDLDGPSSAFHTIAASYRRGSGVNSTVCYMGAAQNSCGADLPSSRTVERTMSVSWSLAFARGFRSALTDFDNLRFICRVYGVGPDGCLPFVEDYTGLGIYHREPVSTYSSGMRPRLAFATSMVIDFDCYLVDGFIDMGDSRFQTKWYEELFVKRADLHRMIISHDAGFVGAHCDRTAVLNDGKLKQFESLDSAYDFYTEAMT